ncbi:MAG: S1C family serine protease [Planctomycetes bacterium]|nr:S1C family serine protease [Planctomycetota bacterium]
MTRGSALLALELALVAAALWRPGRVCAQEVGDVATPAARLIAAQQEVFRTALDTVTPSVVKIETIGGAQPPPADEGGRRRGAQFRQADGPTTGLIWSADGHIVTSSFNFIREPSIITVTLHDGRRFVGQLVARDYQIRLALLKIEASGLPEPRWLSSSDLRLGQWALVAGYGQGSSTPALSVGIVSGLRRMAATAVQTDAKISPANYGGPLFDVEGRVSGVCVPLGANPDDQIAGVEWYDAGIGFAVPIELLRERLARLQRGEDLHRGLLGIGVEIREPVVGLSETDQPSGLRIAGQPRGPGAEAGLREGDIITHLDGVPTRSLLPFKRRLATKAAGDTIKVTYVRAGEAATVEFEMAPLDAFRSPTSQPVNP